MNAAKTTTTHATYEAFYAKQQRNIIGLLIRLFRLSQDDAQELTQEAFLLVWMNWALLLADKSDMERVKWLRTVACRKAIDMLRRKQSRHRFMNTAKELHAYVTVRIGGKGGFQSEKFQSMDSMELAGEFFLAQPDALGTEAQVLMREELCEALDALAHEQDGDSHQMRTRKTIALRAVGYSQQEIADMQQRSTSAVKSDIRRARQVIRGLDAQEVVAA